MSIKDCACIFICSLLFVSSKQQTETTECTLPPQPNHGSWKILNGEGNPGEKVFEASVLKFECKPGYKLSSNSLLVCIGQWSSPVPECEGALSSFYDNPDHTNYFRVRRETDNGCALPPHPDHGSWKILNGKGNPGDKVPIASVLTFECRPEYKLSNSIAIVCLQGQWSLPIPECEELCPPLYPSTTYDLRCINKVGNEVNCSEATHGTNLEYTCKTYYETPFGYKKTLYCENGKWDLPKPICQPVCGKKVADDTQSLIYGYNAITNKKIEHPWVAAIFAGNNGSYENICGGSILSQTVVLTAAHCVTNDYGDVWPKENYRVGVGKIYRKYEAPGDTSAQYLELSKIVVPNEYKGDIRKFTADIAVLVTKKEITVSEVVQPVCFTNMNSIHLYAGNQGEVSGWGLTEGEVPSEVLKTLVIPYKHETTCANELPRDWADRYNLKDKICAGFVNKSTSVCTGDSGGGLAFKHFSDNRYYIHGIVSLSHKVGHSCNIQQNALYTSVASHYEFVDRLLTMYAPKARDCILPPYPQNGKWTTEQQDLKPGDAVASDTVLKMKCYEGFQLTSKRTVECSKAHKAPTCQKLCERPRFPRNTVSQCVSTEKQGIDCSTALEGSTLSYLCPSGYKAAGDSFRTCINGSWGSPAPECIRECGIKLNDTSDGYPWNVIIYKLTNNTEERYKYVCGGSLVSKYVIVTAPQCVTDETGHLLSMDDFLIAAGKLYSKYNDPRDQHAEYTNISYINIHPEYKKSGGSYFNIAFLIASIPFKFNNFIQPVCIAEGVYNNYKSYENKGIMTGWRFTDGVSPETIQSVDVLLPKNGCKIPRHLSFTDLFTVQNECSKFQNKSTCLLPEDIGKSIVVKRKQGNVYYLGGIVLYFGEKGCQKYFWHSNLMVFTDLIDFTTSYL